MNTYQIYRQQVVPASIEEAWEFFSSPLNLRKITPENLRLRILTDNIEREIFEGMKIHYTVAPILKVPLRWTTIITDVDRPFGFTDRQQKGPYALWEHRHSFKEVEGGTEVTDQVTYALPLGALGGLAHILLVKKQLTGIFDFRSNALNEIFGDFNRKHSPGLYNNDLQKTGQ